MGARTWMLGYSDGSMSDILKSDLQLDRQQTVSLVTKLFPSEKLEPLQKDGDLSYTNPPDDELFAGHFGKAAILAAKEFALDNPSRLDIRFINAGGKQIVALHAMHSVVDWFAFAIWRDGKLQRALSLSPDSGIMEDFGARLPFEEPFWNGEHTVGDDYPF